MTLIPMSPAEEERHNMLVSMLVFNMKNILNALSALQPFHNGDVMSACIHLLVDTGMRAVIVDKAITREELIKQLTGAFTDIVMNHDGVLDDREIVPTHEGAEVRQ